MALLDFRLSKDAAKALIFLLCGLVIAPAAEAACVEGTLTTCVLPNGCGGKKECVSGQFGPCECVGATSQSCSVCGRVGSLQCDSSCQPGTNSCLAAR